MRAPNQPKAVKEYLVKRVRYAQAIIEQLNLNVCAGNSSFEDVMVKLDEAEHWLQEFLDKV